MQDHWLVYGNNINLKLIIDPLEKQDVTRNLQHFLLRLAYKMQRILPFQDELLSSLIECIFSMTKFI